MTREHTGHHVHKCGQRESQTKEVVAAEADDIAKLVHSGGSFGDFCGSMGGCFALLYAVLCEGSLDDRSDHVDLRLGASGQWRASGISGGDRVVEAKRRRCLVRCDAAGFGNAGLH